MLLNFLNSDSASRFLSLQTSNKHFLMAPVHTLSSPELVYIHVSSIYTIGCCSKFRWHGFAQVPLLLIHIQELQQCFCDTIYFYLKIGTNSDLRLLFFHYCSVMSDSLQPHGLHPGNQASLSFTISWSWLRIMSIEPMMPSKHFILCCSLLLPSIYPSIRVFSNQSVLCIRGPKYWHFSFSINPFNEYSWGCHKIKFIFLLSLIPDTNRAPQRHAETSELKAGSFFYLLP